MHRSIKARTKANNAQSRACFDEVDKLHQQCIMQVDTMKDFSWQRFDDYNFNKGGLQFIPENKSRLAQSGSFGFQHEPRRYSAFMQKPVDLQLSADEFINHYVDDCLGNINLSLDLSIGQSKDKDHKRYERNKSCASSSEVIDLEDPSFALPNNNTNHVLPCFAATKSFSKDKHKSESFLQIGMNHFPYESSARECVSGVGSSCQRPRASYSGHIGHHREFLNANLFSKNQTSEACTPKNLDLNMVQFDYSSCLANNFSMMRNPSRKNAMTSSSTSWNKAKANVIDLSDSSDKCRQFDLNIDLTNSCGDNKEYGWNKGDNFRIVDSGGICVIDLDSDSGEPCSSNKSNLKIESVDSSSKFLNNQTHAQNQVSDERPDSPKLPSSSGSDHINDGRSNTSQTQQSVVKCEDLNFCTCDEHQKETSCPSTDNRRELDQKSSDNTESNIQYINNQKLEADDMVQKAAESLVKISSETRVCHQPQCWSSDTYEEMVLWAKESDLDDLCVSSNAFVVEESENKTSRYKLKRGTRMKDFQKDVLPSLSILSRHEIREDINIMEGVIRSREYRKMRAKSGDDGEVFRAGRSKRSRAGYNRRYYE